MAEKQIEEKLRDLVKAAGGRAFKFVSPGNRGVSDRLIFMPGGKVYLVETKDGNKPLSPNQIQFRRVMYGLGTDTYVLRSKEDVLKFMENICKIS